MTAGSRQYAVRGIVYCLLAFKQAIPNAALSSIPPSAANNPPTAVLNATPTSGTAPLVVSF